MEIKKSKTFKVVGQQHTSVKLVYGRYFQKFYLLSPNGLVLATKAYPRLHKMPRWLGKLIIKLITPSANRFKTKVLRIDKMYDSGQVYIKG